MLLSDYIVMKTKIEVSKILYVIIMAVVYIVAI